MGCEAMASIKQEEENSKRTAVATPNLLKPVKISKFRWVVKLWQVLNKKKNQQKDSCGHSAPPCSPEHFTGAWCIAAPSRHCTAMPQAHAIPRSIWSSASPATTVGLEEHSGRPRKIFRYYAKTNICLLYTSPSPRDGLLSRMPSSA